MKNVKSLNNIHDKNIDFKVGYLYDFVILDNGEPRSETRCIMECINTDGKPPYDGIIRHIFPGSVWVANDMALDWLTTTDEHIMLKEIGHKDNHPEYLL